jgi:hypothetical protein
MQPALRRCMKLDEKGRPLEWDGGYIRYDARGHATYYINLQRDGVRYHYAVARRAGPASVELDRFEKDPAGYRRGKLGADQKPIYLTRALVDQYLDYSRAPEPDGAGNTDLWVQRKEEMLTWWAEKLVDDRRRQLDLRRIPAHFIVDLLDGRRSPKASEWEIRPTTDKRTKKNVIKGFYSWLRQVRRLVTRNEDPVMDMPVGPGRAAITESGVPKDQVKREHVQAVIEWGLERKSIYAHVLGTQAGLGWHTTEMMLFRSLGTIEVLQEGEEEPGMVAKLVCPKHKNRKLKLKTKVPQNVLDHAKAMMAWKSHYRGKGDSQETFSRSNYEKFIHDACDALAIPRFNSAWMRHTNATFAKKRRHDPRAFLGHAKGSTMVDKHYAPNAAPAHVPTIMDPPEVLSAHAPTSGQVAELQARIKELEATLEDRKTGVLSRLEKMLASVKN